MSAIQEILKSKAKLKGKITELAEKLKNDELLVSELMKCFKGASVAERGTCIAAIEHITKEDPQFADSCLEFVIEQISDDAPRVKWEASCVVANVAKAFPERGSKAIPRLLENTEDNGTVVRWSTAFALTEIAKNNPKTHKELVPIFTMLVQKEKNNGVKNVYLKALKVFKKYPSNEGRREKRGLKNEQN